MKKILNIFKKDTKSQAYRESMPPCTCKFFNYTKNSDLDKYGAIYAFLAWRYRCPHNTFCNFAVKAIPLTDTTSTVFCALV